MPSPKSGKAAKPKSADEASKPKEAMDTAAGAASDATKGKPSENESAKDGSTTLETDSSKQETEEKKKKKPKAKAKWSKEWVTPDHNSNYPPASAPTDTVPDEAKVKLIVETTDVPDGTTAAIKIAHCKTGTTPEGGNLSGLEVKGNKIIDPSTGKEPEWFFEQKHDHWDPYNAPYYMFRATIDYEGLSAETPKKYKTQKKKCLRVRYWHMLVAETGSLSGTLPECNDVHGILNKASKHSVSMVQQLGTPNQPMAQVGSLLRNTYVFHVASHGNIYEKSQRYSYGMHLHGSIQPPDFADHTHTTPAQDKGKLPGGYSKWRSAVCIGSHTPDVVPFAKTYGPQNGSTFNNRTRFFDESDLGAEADFPSVPKYLFYASTCLTGWEPSFANKLIARGCRNVLCFKRTVPDAEAPELAKKFYKKWMKKHKLNPEKIPDVFFQVAPDHYDNMRPVLYGKGGGAAGGDGTAPSAAEIAAVAIGAVLVGAAIGFAVYNALK